jgi:pectate lyase
MTASSFVAPAVPTFSTARKITICLFVVMAAISSNATLFFTDQFNYTDGADLGATSGGGGTTWSVASGDVTQIKVSSAATQTSPNGYATAAGFGVAVTPTGSRKATGVPFNGATGIPVADGNVVYASFLLNVQTLPTSGNIRVVYMHNGAASQAAIEVVVSSAGQVGIQKKGSGTTFVSGTPVATPGTHLVVMRYTFQTGSDEVAVWVDPDSSTYGVDPAPSTGAFAATTGGGSDMTSSILHFFIDSPAVTGPMFWIDEVRVATTWAEVTPSSTPITSAPSINSDLADQDVPVGQDATFNVIASGTSPLSYHWFYNTNTLVTNGIVSSSATSSSLTVTNAQLSDAGGYSVVVTNSFGSVTSLVAHLIVDAPVAPTIGTQPQNQTNILPGATTIFSVVAFGSDPLNYQWFYNTNTLVPNATAPILTITNVQAADGGSYSVIISNPAGTTNSAFAFLTVNTNPVAPVFNSQPAALVVLAGNPASFTVLVSGTAPINYQWNINGTPIPGATSSTLNLSNVQTTNSGSYTLTASNSVGKTTSDPAQLTVTTVMPVVNSEYNLVGFGQATTGGGVIPDTDPAYAKVTTPLELANAVLGFNKNGNPKVIEIMNDLNLGWNEIGSAVQGLGSTPFTAHNPPQLHPILLQTGVSKMDIKYKNGGLTIFSANGATIRHCTFNIKSTHNIIVRNLKFDEMWEWDEATKGQYDKNDWDFIDLANGGAVSNIWIDHCTFTKTYDGIVDMKAGSTGVTLSWCKYTGDDGATNPNSFVWQQINSLESNKTSYAFYNFLRNNGFSTTNIVTIIQGHDKTHLLGANDHDPNNANIWVTFHHLWMKNVWDRAVPRLRAGNVHDFNNYVDDTDALAALRLRNAVQATMNPSSSNTLQNTYSINPPLNGSISTEGGAVLVEKCVYIDSKYPLRNNQTDVNDPSYTGKILGLDMIYQFDSTVVRGNSTDPGSPLGPFQAPIIPFSWNPASGAPGGQLPYTYTMDDPAQLQAIVTSPTAGAGAAVLMWAKTNWLMTAYAATAPFIVAQPQNVNTTPGQSTTFTVVAGGSADLHYQWYFNTNTPLLNATNSGLTLFDLQTTNSGFYSVMVTNLAGSVTSTNVSLNVTVGAPAAPQVSNVSYNNGIFSLTIAGDSGPDYIVQASTNLTSWTSLYTNHSATPPFDWTDYNAINYARRFYRVLLGP